MLCYDWVCPFTVKKKKHLWASRWNSRAVVSVQILHRLKTWFSPLELQYCSCEDRYSALKYGSAWSDLIWARTDLICTHVSDVLCTQILLHAQNLFGLARVWFCAQRCSALDFWQWCHMNYIYLATFACPRVFICPVSTWMAVNGV